MLNEFPYLASYENLLLYYIMRQVTKLLLEIVMDRMKGKIETELGDAQSGFRQGKGTREGLLYLRLICERHLEVQKDVYISS